MSSHVISHWGTPPAVRVWESHFTLYRTIWKSHVMAAFVQPMLYLLGMGLGVGALVDEGANSPQLLDGLSYFQFLAPGLLATTAMMVSSGEAMWPVVGGFKWTRAFHAQAASPLTSGNITRGLVLWEATRAGIAVGGVAAVLALFPSTRSWGLLLAIPFGVLTGLAFATPIAAWSSTRETDDSFPSIMRFGITPLFLFGGAFYPIDELPDWLQWVAKVTPLWHGVELCRGAVHHRLTVDAAIVHVAVLLAFTVAGMAVLQVTFARRLSK
jgi:lipooligosaccharide transport system permease protein